MYCSATHNLQGDIVGIDDSNGGLVVEYGYDAWGKPVVVRTLTTAYEALAKLNPFRYRGYMYDAETDIYDLRNRMYIPAWGRFPLPDVMVASERSFRDNNVYAYCGCEPVGNADIDGNWWPETCINWVSDNIIEPVVEGVEEAVNSVKEAVSNINFTLSVGLNFTLSVGTWAFNVQIGLSLDFKGNIAAQATFSGGGTSNGEAGVSLVGTVMMTNAPTIYHLENTSYQIGGSISGIPVPFLGGLPIGTIGADFNIIPNSEGGNYYGITLGAGAAIKGSKKVEVHGEVANTLPSWTILGNRPDLPAPNAISPAEKERMLAFMKSHPLSQLSAVEYIGLRIRNM